MVTHLSTTWTVQASGSAMPAYSDGTRIGIAAAGFILGVLAGGFLLWQMAHRKTRAAITADLSDVGLFGWSSAAQRVSYTVFGVFDHGTVDSPAEMILLTRPALVTVGHESVAEEVADTAVPGAGQAGGKDFPVLDPKGAQVIDQRRAAGRVTATTGARPRDLRYPGTLEEGMDRVRDARSDPRARSPRRHCRVPNGPRVAGRAAFKTAVATAALSTVANAERSIGAIAAGVTAERLTAAKIAELRNRSVRQPPCLGG